jgi:ribosomal protein S27AE
MIAQDSRAEKMPEIEKLRQICVDCARTSILASPKRDIRWCGATEQQQCSWCQRSSRIIAFHFSLLHRWHQASQQTLVSMPQEEDLKHRHGREPNLRLTTFGPVARLSQGRSRTSNISMGWLLVLSCVMVRKQLLVAGPQS